MTSPLSLPVSTEDIVRHDCLAYLDAAIENFHDSVEDGRRREHAMQMFFSDTSEQIVIVVGQLNQILTHHDARAFLMEQYLPRMAAFIEAEATKQ